MRALWILFGFLSLALGLVGIPLPLLPTVPFLLLSAFCFARSSKRLHQWLLHHPKLGPPIHNWVEHGAIGIRAKVSATLMIALTFGIAIVFQLPVYVLMIHIVTLSCVMIFIWSRPSY